MQEKTVSSGETGPASDRLLGDILTHITDIVLLAGRDGAIAFANPAFRHLASPAGDQARTDLFGVIHPEDRERVAAELSTAFQGGTQHELSFRLLFPGGVIRYMEGTVRRAPDSERVQDLLLLVAQDVTHLHEAETKERLLAHAVSCTRDCFCLTDLDDTILFVNPAFCEVYGYTEEELVGEKVTIVRSPRMQDPGYKEVIARTASGEWYGEIINRRKDGTEFPIELWVSVVRDQRGVPVAHAGITRDISDRKRIEEERQANLAMFQSLIENLMAGILVQAEDKSVFLVNQEFCRIFSVDRSQLPVGLPERDLYRILGQSVQEPVRFIASAQELSRERDLALGEEILLQNRRILERDYIPIVSRGNRFNGHLWQFRDVTDRRRAAHLLGQSEEKFRTLFEESLDGIIISTPGGIILDINQAALRILGYSSKEEVIHSDIARDIYFNPDDREVFKEALRRDGFVKDFEFLVKRRDGSKRVLSESATAARDAAGEIISYRGFIRDITEHRLLEEELMQAQKLEGIGTLAGGIAHDFNNILGIILGYATLIESGGQSAENFTRSTERIKNAVDRGANLVRQLLAFAQKADPTLESVNVNAVVNEIVSMVRQTFPRTITVETLLDSSLPLIVADAGQIHQVLMNLCLNARDAMSEERGGNGGGSLTISTGRTKGEQLRHRFPAATSDEYVSIMVTDTGVGLDENARQRIFEPFFTTKGFGKGSGLGLAVVYGVVNNHHGFTDVVSEPNENTSFTLYFPTARATQQVSPPPPAPEMKTGGGRELILLVEDETLLLELLKNFLEDHGYRVASARDGLEALALFREHHEEISVILSDMGLPGIGGWELFQKMKEIKPDVQVILASGYFDPKLKLDLVNAGARDFIKKPYIVEEILMKLGQIIREAKDAVPGSAG
ncbi:MAG TPA: PAS domain S-box protein [Bacteroidota bacterium]|nr:PAS domain S-box protein [Bacteroidota bacterium]